MKYGYKGNSILIHLIADAEGMPLPAVSTPADADERKQVKPLLEGIEIKTGRAGKPAKKIRRLAGDKGYDSESLRKHIRDQGIPAANSEKEKRKGQAAQTCYDDRAKISS